VGDPHDEWGNVVKPYIGNVLRGVGFHF